MCTKNLCFSSDARSHEPAMLRRWAWILHLPILKNGNGLELAYNRGSCILLPRISFGCKLVAVTYQEYKWGLFSKRIAYIKTPFFENSFPHLPTLVIHYVCHPKFCVTFVLNFSWVLLQSQEKLNSMRIPFFFFFFWGGGGGKEGVLWDMCKWRIEPSPVCWV